MPLNAIVVNMIRIHFILFHVFLPCGRLYLFLINIFSVCRVIILCDQFHLSLLIVYPIAAELHAHARDLTSDTVRLSGDCIQCVFLRYFSRVILVYHDILSPRFLLRFLVWLMPQGPGDYGMMHQTVHIYHCSRRWAALCG
jgi:hypothetical protein